MGVVEMVAYEMKHIERHVLTSDKQLSLHGIHEGDGITPGITCESIELNQYNIMYIVYNTLSNVLSGHSETITLDSVYDEIEVERYLTDADYRFQIDIRYSEVELIYHTRITLFRGMMKHGITSIYFGNLSLLYKVEKLKLLEGTPEWRRKRL